MLRSKRRVIVAGLTLAACAVALSTYLATSRWYASLAEPSLMDTHPLEHLRQSPFRDIVP